ncbi:MAG: N-methyl-L-tryptophan oxidase [Planctomycetaceae bacterium]|nr:N-methyl-L-tryptophan oxidase [Planctomycetaceae bacterium]
MPPVYDAIVLGVGGFGSGALRHLALRGRRVLGIERFGVAHDRGSSHGQTRIIRQAYFEHPDYVPLLFRAYDLWRELERETGRRLLDPVGLFIAGRPECESVAGTLLAARQHNLPVEQLTAADARQRFPGYRFPDEFTVVCEAQAGYLAVEACVAAQVESAVAHGAQLHTGETVLSFGPDGEGVRVRTDRGDYLASRLIVTAGPWAQEMLAASEAAVCGAGPTRQASGRWSDWLRVVRKPVFWFAAGPQYDCAQGNSTFFFETAAGQFYGFPRIDGQTIKVAEHTQGDAVADPLAVDRDLHAADLAPVAAFLAEHIPDVAPRPVQHSVCMYTRTPDCHFIIDRHPHWPAVILGMGFSGHGFKFTTVIGEALAELALDGQTSLPIGFLGLARWG